MGKTYYTEFAFPSKAVLDTICTGDLIKINKGKIAMTVRGFTETQHGSPWIHPWGD